MSFSDAVAVTMNFIVAKALLSDVACLRSGQTILIHSVGGGVVSISYNDDYYLKNFSMINKIILMYGDSG